MLYLTRKVDETIVVNDNVIIKVVEIRNRKVRLGIEFAPTATVLRGEIYIKILYFYLNFLFFSNLLN